MKFRPGPAPGLRYAGAWIRLAALVLDSLPAAVLAAVAVPAVNSRCAAGSATALCALAAGGVATGVFAAVLGIHRLAGWRLLGGSLGQRALGLHVVSAATGKRIGLLRALVRLGGVVVAAAPCGVGLLWTGFDARKQGWHDKIAGTFVVRRS